MPELTLSGPLSTFSDGLLELGADWCVGAEPNVFDRLAGTAQLAIWRRRLPLALVVWLESQLPSWKVPSRIDPLQVDLDADREALAGLVDPLPSGPMREILLTDLVLQVQRLSGVMKLLPGLSRPRSLKVSLAPVIDDQCRKFHVDWVHARLISTYIGQGTEWLTEDNVHRDHVGASSCCPADANRAIVRDPGRVRHAKAGEVLIMKGARWPGSRGVVHRSPSLSAGPEETPRLLWVLTA